MRYDDAHGKATRAAVVLNCGRQIDAGNVIMIPATRRESCSDDEREDDASEANLFWYSLISFQQGVVKIWFEAMVKVLVMTEAPAEDNFTAYKA